MNPAKALEMQVPVTDVASLKAARNELTQIICDVLGVTRDQVSLPKGHLVLYNPSNGVRLTRWEDDQRARVQAQVKAHGEADYRIGIAPGVQRGVLAVLAK